jgi:glucose-fructose oxidoreductase
VYFSDCVVRDLEPEPSDLEGLQDVRIVQSLYESVRTGRPVDIPRFEPRNRPGPEQEIHMPPVRKPRQVNVESPTF